jgi:hypothetical protein
VTELETGFKKDNSTKTVTKKGGEMKDKEKQVGGQSSWAL